jgi:signal transduction histidine kinase
MINLKQERNRSEETQPVIEGQVLKHTEELEARVKELEKQNGAGQVPRSILLSLSYEIRSAMNTVMGMTNLLLDTDLGEDQRECTKAIRVSSEALLTATNKFLEYPNREEMEPETGAFREDEYHLYLLELINSYLENSPHLMDGMSSAVSSGDPVSLQKFANELEKSSVEFGASELIELARDMEVMGREADMISAAEKFVSLEQAYNTFRQALEKKKATLLTS